jgi:hypothetical protein
MRQRVSSSSVGTKSLNKIASELAIGDENQKEGENFSQIE